MSTSIDLIIGYVRAAVQDYDSEAYIYSEEALKQQISLTALGVSFDLSGAPNTTYDQDSDGNFVNDLTAQQKIIIGIKTAIRLLANVPTEFSWRSPVMSVTRKRSYAADVSLMNTLEDMLASAEGGRFAIAVDTDFNMILQGFDRFLNDYYRAETAWTGNTQ